MRYKIILITEFSKPWNNGWYYKSGFEKNGHTVIPLDPEAYKNPADKIFETTKEIRPDFILHTKDELPAAAFHELRQLTRVIMWYPDPVIPDWLPRYVSASDVFLTMSEGLIPEFKKYNPHIFWLTQGFEPSSFEIREITHKDEQLYSSEVTFVGNLGSKTQYLKRRDALEGVINAGLQLKWWGPKIPRKISTIPLLVGKLGRAYGGKFVWGEEYAKIARLSKVFLAFDSMPHIRKSMSARMYTAVGCGAFYLCQHVAGIEEVLEPGKEIVTFQVQEEMKDLARYYLGKDELRRKIADAGRRRIMNEHTYETRMRQLTDIVKDFL